MARALISRPRLKSVSFSIALLLSTFLLYFVAPTQSILFQPVLTGFRCEGYNEVTADGVVIIEADTAVKVTLFGEYFTTETIVGFTTEFVPHADVVDQMISKNHEHNVTTATLSSHLHHTQESAQIHNLNTSIKRVARSISGESASNILATDIGQQANSTKSQVTTLASGTPKVSARSYHPPPPKKPLTEAELKLKRRRRRLLDSRSYDCTDYDRVISYRLAEENIVTPNVAKLTIKLPELGSLSNGIYYYFCLKQPPVPSKLLAFEEEHVEPSTTALSSRYEDHHAGDVNKTRHVWVHQGDESWLMIKVEPPILSIANDCILIILLLFLSAVTSGLNLGLMSLDMNELAVISSCGDQRERSYARTIAPLRKRGNYLLCSLLLGNVMVNSTLTVILEEMTSGVVAVIGSTLAIVVLGEIVPQAFCARQGLAIGAKTIYLTYAFMIITFPLSYPISCLLDCILGAEKGHVYDRERLMEFIRITGNHTQLEADEVAIISGALKLKKIKVDQIMTKLEDVFMLPIDCMLDRKTIRSIIEKGYSRIPVYEFGDRKQIVALILAKDLALLDPDDQMPLASMLMYCKHPLIFIEDTATLDVALNEFKTGKSHMAIVRQIYDDGEVDKYYEAIGVVTLEDVIEEVLQTEINDETDTLSDNRRKRRRTEAQVAHLVDELIMESPTKLK